MPKVDLDGHSEDPPDADLSAWELRSALIIGCDLEIIGFCCWAIGYAFEKWIGSKLRFGGV
ncbi:hypothetical protein ABWW58_10615 [Sporolactobacillus sp. STCC-11]|uniref:hypothetical protein n=1 Tax=Sporolactobacillus caesalpiniae TaxID=3230362 RepID=UPI003398E586